MFFQQTEWRSFQQALWMFFIKAMWMYFTNVFLARHVNIFQQIMKMFFINVFQWIIWMPFLDNRMDGFPRRPYECFFSRPYEYAPGLFRPALEAVWVWAWWTTSPWMLPHTHTHTVGLIHPASNNSIGEEWNGSWSSWVGPELRLIRCDAIHSGFGCSTDKLTGNSVGWLVVFDGAFTVCI